MSGRIKGVSIEIGGDTKKLETALKNVNKEVKVTEKELKDINKLLKFDPKNTDLLKQKQVALNNSIKASSDKLKELKEIEKELAKDPGQADKWRVIQREIIDTENRLKSLEKQQNANNNLFNKAPDLASKFDKVGDKFVKIGGNIESAGNKLKPLSATMTATAGLSAAAWNEVDGMMDTVVKKTGATGDSLRQLQDVAKNVFTSEVAPSALDAGNAVGELNTRFGFTGEVLEKASIDFLKFAKVTDQDVNSAIISVSRAMGDAGIEASQYGKVLDELTVAGQASGISVDKLTDMLTKFGAPMRQLGFDTKESIALFSSWEKAGVNTEIAFSGMKKAIGNWAKEGKDARVEFRKTLDEISKAPDLASATTKAIEIFGQKAGPDLADAIKGGRFSFEEMMQVLDESQGKLEQTFQNQDDAVNQAKSAFNSLKVAGAELGGALLETLAPMIKQIAEKMRDWATKFRELDPQTKNFIAKLVLFSAALAPTLIGIGKFVTGVGRLSKGISSTIKFFKVGENGVSKFGSIISKTTKVFTSFSSGILKVGTTVAKFVKNLNLLNRAKSIITGVANAFKLLRLAFATNPFGVIVLALTALGVALVTAYKKSETFRNIVDNAFSKVKEVIKVAWQTVIKPIFDKLVGVWDSIVTAWNTHSETIKNTFREMWEDLKSTWENFWNTWKPVFEIAWEFLKNTFDNVWQAIKGIWDVFAGFFTGDWDRVWNGVKEVASAIWEQIKNTFNTILNLIWETVSTIIENIYNWISEKFSAVSNFVSETWSTIKQNIANFITEAWQTVRNKASEMLNSVSEYFGQIPGKIKGLWNEAVGYLKGINLFQIGWDIIEGLANGLSSAGNWLYERARSIASGVIESMKSALGINSPAKEAIPIGEDTGGGVIVGLDNIEEDVVDKAEGLSNSMLSGLSDTVLEGGVHSDLTMSYELSQNSSVISTLNGVVKELNGIKQNFNVTSVVEVDGREIARSSQKEIDYLNGLNFKKLRGVW